ncbi:MAG: acyl--CoA ligase [bacterium]|nr:acyl--CoA ligase [bacterium]
MRVENFLIDSARRLPNKTAIIAGGDRISYGELDKASDNLAASMVSEGICAGDRVVLFMSNCIEAVITIFAVQKAGAILVPLHDSTKPDKLSRIMKNCEARAILSEEHLLPNIDGVREQVPSLIMTINVGNKTKQTACRNFSFEQATSHDGKPPENPGTDLDLSTLVYTSGSTGVPKGVMMTHGSTVLAERSIAGYLEHSEDDILLSVLPFSSSYGLNQVFLALSTGATLVLEKSFAYSQIILNKIKEHNVTGFPLVPTMAAMLLQMKNIKPDDFLHLRYITNAAASLPVSHINKLQKLFPMASLYSMYGQTECKRGTWMPPEQLEKHPGSVGIAIPGTTAYVVDEQGAVAAPGETGELVISGNHLMKGYWNDDEATKKVLRPGPLPGQKILHTGDLFTADEDGFLYFVARKDDIIKTKGEKVAPREVEIVLHELDEVGEAVVIGIPDAIFGEVLKAIIIPVDKIRLDKRQIMRHCARRLESFKVPASIEFLKEMPKLANGKIHRRILKQQIMESVA